MIAKINSSKESGYIKRTTDTKETKSDVLRFK